MDRYTEIKNRVNDLINDIEKYSYIKILEFM